MNLSDIKIGQTFTTGGDTIYLKIDLEIPFGINTLTDVTCALNLENYKVVVFLNSTKVNKIIRD